VHHLLDVFVVMGRSADVIVRISPTVATSASAEVTGAEQTVPTHTYAAGAFGRQVQRR
jgi:hypothetical protein